MGSSRSPETCDGGLPNPSAGSTPLRRAPASADDGMLADGVKMARTLAKKGAAILITARRFAILTDTVEVVPNPSVSVSVAALTRHSPTALD